MHVLMWSINMVVAWCCLYYLWLFFLFFSNGRCYSTNLVGEGFKDASRGRVGERTASSIARALLSVLLCAV